MLRVLTIALALWWLDPRIVSAQDRDEPRYVTFEVSFYDAERRLDNGPYQMEYRFVNEDEELREINRWAVTGFQAPDIRARLRREFGRFIEVEIDQFRCGFGDSRKRIIYCTTEQ